MSKPTCDCWEAMFWERQRRGRSNINETLVLTKSEDGETCDYCGYYVKFKISWPTWREFGTSERATRAERAYVTDMETGVMYESYL